jgi:RNA polymerase sigma factor (sigma-70 family)
VLDQNSRAGARLTSLYEAHAVDAFRYALHLTGRREDAEDVVQHVFLQAHAMLLGGRELVNPRAWLIKATKHRSLNLLRDRRDTPTAEVDASVPFASGESEAEALAEVRAALWSLPETQHHAFVLRHWSGLSQDEIAEVLATTPGAVESLLVRARATLVAEREETDSECAGVRSRLARMLAPTPAHEAHLAGCRRCRTAQSRLLRASEFATAFALVPSPHVLGALASAIPGFGASGAAAGASATGAAVGTGGGSAAVSTVSVATKAGLLTKVAIAATTAAVAVTAVHPLRTAVTHALFHHGSAASAAIAPKRAAAHPASSHAAAGGGASASTRGGAAPARGGAGTTTRGHGPAKPGGGGKGGAGGAAGNGGGNGNGNGNGTGNGNGQGTGGGSNGATKGKSATAPGHTKAAGGAATGKGKAAGAGNGAANGKGTKAQSAGPTKTTSDPGSGGTTTKPDGGNGNGATNANAGGSGKGNGTA